jgi:hypothetical protein
MCNPVAIGLMVAGTALSVNAQNKRQTAMKNAAEDAQQAELMRQQSLSKERQDSLQPTFDNATRQSQDAALAAAAEKRNSAYENATTLPGDQGTDSYQAPSAAAAEGQPKVVQEEAAKQRSKADSEVRSIGDARARLMSYGDVGLGNQILNQNATNNINMLGGFSRMSSALLPGEVQAAMNSKAGKYRGQELLGTALSMYGGAGAPGMFGGAAAAAGAGAGAGATGTYGAALNSGAASTLGSVAPSAGGAALGSNLAMSAFPTAAGAGAGAGMGLGGLLSGAGQIAPLFGNNTTRGYLPSWLNPQSAR